MFGSGETSATGRKIFDHLMRVIAPAGLPQVAILETPAGFELNSPQVAGRVAEFLEQRLQNYQPQTTIIPARKRGTPYSPDDPQIVAPILKAGLVFLGPGSPTYTARQLGDSLAWHSLVACQRLGAALVLASAAAIAFGAFALPVYEIFKVGEDLHWKPGLDFFGPYGLQLVFIPHWNNREGGKGLDTSRCFMGRARFEPLLSMLPPEVTVAGIDENTALKIDVQSGVCSVLGKDTVTILRNEKERQYSSGDSFVISELGPAISPDLAAGLPPEVWQQALAARADMEDAAAVPKEVRTLVAARERARACQDWAASDELRGQIAKKGWQVQDTQHGPRLEKLEKPGHGAV